MDIVTRSVVCIPLKEEFIPASNKGVRKNLEICTKNGLRPGRRLSEQSVLLTWLEGKHEISDHFVGSKDKCTTLSSALYWSD